MNEEKRLRKEQKIIRGFYEILVPDELSFSDAQALTKPFVNEILNERCVVMYHEQRAGWKKRV